MKKNIQRHPWYDGKATHLYDHLKCEDSGEHVIKIP